MDKQRIEILRSTLEDLEKSDVSLLDGELCLISSRDKGYDTIIAGDGKTKARDLPRVTLNRSNGCVFQGVATPDTNPGENPWSNMFYLAYQEGSYPHFGGLEVKDGDLDALIWKNESWTREHILEGIAKTIDVVEEINDIKSTAIFKVYLGDEELTRDENGSIKIKVDGEVNESSNYPVSSKAVAAELKKLDWFEGE